MNFLSLIIVVGVAGFIVLVARSLRSMPSGRPNFEEKELTYTQYDRQPISKSKKRYLIKQDGTINYSACGC